MPRERRDLIIKTTTTTIIKQGGGEKTHVNRSASVVREIEVIIIKKTEKKVSGVKYERYDVNATSLSPYVRVCLWIRDAVFNIFCGVRAHTES